MLIFQIEGRHLQAKVEVKRQDKENKAGRTLFGQREIHIPLTKT